MKKFLIALIALFVLAAIPGVMAYMDVKVSDSYSSPVSVIRGDTIPIEVAFSEDTDYQDVTIEVQLRYENGKKVEVSSKAIDVIDGTVYVKTLDIKVPQDIEATAPGEVYALSVEMKDGNGNQIEFQSFDLTVQRENAQLEIQKVLKTSTIDAGKTLQVTVVVKNTGSDRMEDVYVKMSIPDLGLSTEKYVGDLVTEDNGDEKDTKSAVLSLDIPSTATQGTYSLEIEAYNDDTETTKKESLLVSGSQKVSQATEIYANKIIQNVEQGKTASYKFTLLNVNGNPVTYSMSIEGTDGWATSTVDPATVTLQKDSTATVTVYVTANKNAALGQHIATVTVKSGNTIVKQLSVVSEVTESGFAMDPLLITAVVLAIILVVLIVILVKTRKEESRPEEESYY